MKPEGQAYTRRNPSPEHTFFSKNHAAKSKSRECMRVLCLHYFCREKKCSEEESSFCIESTQLRFAISEVVIAAIVWFIQHAIPCPMRLTHEVVIIVAFAEKGS